MKIDVEIGLSPTAVEVIGKVTALLERLVDSATRNLADPQPTAATNKSKTSSNSSTNSKRNSQSSKTKPTSSKGKGTTTKPKSKSSKPKDDVDSKSPASGASKTTETETDGPTVEDAIKAFTEWDGPKAKAAKLLKKLGVSKINDLEGDQIAEFIAELAVAE